MSNITLHWKTRFINELKYHSIGYISFLMTSKNAKETEDTNCARNIMIKRTDADHLRSISRTDAIKRALETLKDY